MVPLLLHLAFPPVHSVSDEGGAMAPLTEARSCAVMVGQATLSSCGPDLQPWYWVGTGGVPYFTRERLKALFTSLGSFLL